MKDKKYALITSLIILLPCAVGLALWNVLPEEMPTHFGASGQTNGWSSKAFGVFGIPVTMLAAHWLCIWAAKWDRRNWGHNEKMMKIILWTFPGVSVMSMATVYGTALGLKWNISRLMLILLGLLFIGLGNYLPKCRQNATLGIKLKWTLYNEENWNKTHRFGGKVWVAAGVGLLAMSFLPIGFGGVTLALVLVMVAAPVLYSYLLYKKQVRLGTWVESEGSREARQDPAMQRMGKVGALLAVCILILTAAVMFSGDIEVVCDEAYFTVEASYWEDRVVYYDTVTSVEYRSEKVDGIREWGFGSPRLLLGTFRNEEFGLYTRYTYTSSESCVIVTLNWEDTLVLSGINSAETETIAQTLAEKMG